MFIFNARTLHAISRAVASRQTSLLSQQSHLLYRDQIFGGFIDDLIYSTLNAEAYRPPSHWLPLSPKFGVKSIATVEWLLSGK